MLNRTLQSFPNQKNKILQSSRVYTNALSGHTEIQEHSPHWIYLKLTMCITIQRPWEILPSGISEQEAAGKVINSYGKN